MSSSFPILAIARIGIILLTSNPSRAQSEVLPSKINIYCTSNLDGTGQCFEVRTNTLLKCTGVPGEIIPCRVPGGPSYTCIFFSEALLACNQVVAKSIEERTDKILNRSPFQVDLDDVFNEPLVDPTDRGTSWKDDQTKPINGEKPPIKAPTQQKIPILMPTW